MITLSLLTLLAGQAVDFALLVDTITPAGKVVATFAVDTDQNPATEEWLVHLHRTPTTLADQLPPEFYAFQVVAARNGRACYSTVFGHSQTKDAVTVAGTRLFVTGPILVTRYQLLTPACHN